MRMRKEIAAAILICANLQAAFAGSGASFLKIPVGARAVGMGNAYSAVANDVTALHWNPAALSRLRQKEISVMHAELFADTRYDFVGYGMPLGAGQYVNSRRSDGGFDPMAANNPLSKTSNWAMGVSAVYLSHGSLEGRDEAGAKTGDFAANDFAFHMGFSRKVSERSHFGMTMKTIRQAIDSQSATGVAGDLGFVTRLPRLAMGVSVLNLGPSMKFSNETYALPLTLSVGTGYSLNGGFILSFDYRHRLSDNVSSLGLGGEFNLLSSFSLRAGYLNNLTSLRKSGESKSSVSDQFTGLGMGFGLRAFKSQIDYAVTPMGELGLTQRLSLSVRY